MEKEYFVDQDSIVRKIWGQSDTILFIFAGAAAEFALSKAVDWLYFTGRLPKDPLGRLMSTVKYARLIVFADQHSAEKAIDSMAQIHAGVEGKRGMKIPDWAYRDVLFMLIDYSIRSYELLYRKLRSDEKVEVFEVFYSVGKRMGIKGLPLTYNEWVDMRTTHLKNNILYSHYTKDLFVQYRKHLGLFRYLVLLESQKMVVPKRVSSLLNFRRFSYLKPTVPIYQLSRYLGMNNFIKTMLLPPKYKDEIKALDVAVN